MYSFTENWLNTFCVPGRHVQFFGLTSVLLFSLCYHRIHLLALVRQASQNPLLYFLLKMIIRPCIWVCCCAGLCIKWISQEYCFPSFWWKATFPLKKQTLYVLKKCLIECYSFQLVKFRTLKKKKFHMRLFSMSGLEHFQRECPLDELVFNSHIHKPLSIHRKGPNPPGPPGLHNSGWRSWWQISGKGLCQNC